jgi:hypothetical protein
MTGALAMAKTSRVDKDFLNVNIDGISGFGPVHCLERNMEQKRTSGCRAMSSNFTKYYERDTESGIDLGLSGIDQEGGKNVVPSLTTGCGAVRIASRRAAGRGGGSL